jgi:hypothetical protein
LETTANGYTNFESSYMMVATLEQPYISRTILHELGHAIGLLDDEYLYSTPGNPTYQHNCRPRNGATPVYPSGYADENWINCSNNLNKRPSSTSLMNSGGPMNQNIMSCGYTIYALLKRIILEQNYDGMMSAADRDKYLGANGLYLLLKGYFFMCNSSTWNTIKMTPGP